MSVPRNLFSLAIAMTAVASLLAASHSQAATLAFSDFDGRTAAGPSTVGLAWTLAPGGLADPGDMTNGSANLFDGSAVTQNSFTPGVNVGNTNSTWITEVDITALAASTVTLTDVTFIALSVSGGQAINVNRRNDFIVSLIDPSNTTLETITVPDVVSGTGVGTPTVTIDFADVVLGAGSYTLRIEAGDAPGVGSNETGNHTGIDSLSINGEIGSAIPEPTSLALVGFTGLILLTLRRMR